MKKPPPGSCPRCGKAEHLLRACEAKGFRDGGMVEFEGAVSDAEMAERG